jgi:hypothetical protein
MHRSDRVTTIVIWSLALVVSVAAARYFLNPPPLLRPPDLPWLPRGIEADAAANVAPHLFENHKLLFRLHIACGIAAITLGLFQFIAALRRARPAVHRCLGLAYVTAVLIGGVSGFPLSFYITDAVPASMRPSVYPAVAGFASLAVAWTTVTAIAFVRARQRNYDSHRAWMIRSYCLTFAAVTVRLAAPPLLLITGNVTLTVTGSIWTWILNAAVAEWLVRRKNATQTARRETVPATG